MSVENSGVELMQVAAALAATSPSMAARQLLRASEALRLLAAESALARIVLWVREFLANPHPELGRSGPVCPFAPAALNMDTVWLTEVTDSSVDMATIGQILGTYREIFLELEPKHGPPAMNKAVLIVFPNLGAAGAALVDEVQFGHKAKFVDAGLMLGEFHSTNMSPGLRNEAFFPLRSPVPMLAIRHMVETDLPFLRRDLDPPQTRVAFLRSYIRRLGGVMSRNNFDLALESLLKAEMQARGSDPAVIDQVIPPRRPLRRAELKRVPAANSATAAEPAPDDNKS